MNLFIILFIVYLLAINFYSFLLIKSQKDESDNSGEVKKSGDGKLILAGFLGGALTIYISMFIFKYRIKNIILMILMPMIAAINIYIIFILFRSGFVFLYP